MTDREKLRQEIYLQLKTKSIELQSKPKNKEEEKRRWEEYYD